MTSGATATLEIGNLTSDMYGTQNVVNALRGLNGTRKKVLAGIQDALGASECLWHISFSHPQTTIADVVKDDHPLMPCKNCSAYELTNYDCPHYRSSALYALRDGVKGHIANHPEDRVISLLNIIQKRLPESYKISF